MDKLLEQYFALQEQKSKLTLDMEEVEAKIKLNLGAPEELNGSKTITQGDVKFTLSGKLNRTIDSNKLKDIAKEHNISDCLDVIFSWKPTVVAKEWTGVSDEYKNILAQSFTEKYGKVSLKITKKEAK